MEQVCILCNSRGHSSLLPCEAFTIDQRPYTHNDRLRFNHSPGMHMCLQHRTHICVHACTQPLTCTGCSPLFHGKGLHAAHHGNIASDSKGSIACLVVVVVSVIQEQLLRRPWIQRSFLPGACHWLTQAWCVSSPWAHRACLSIWGAVAPVHTTHQPQPKSLTWPQEPQNPVSSLNWQDNKTQIIQL